MWGYRQMFVSRVIGGLPFCAVTVFYYTVDGTFPEIIKQTSGHAETVAAKLSQCMQKELAVMNKRKEVKIMWKCPKCGRNFKNTDAQHYCKKMETIDAYIGEQDEKLRPLLEKVREVIRAAAPEAKEKISWQMPTFWHEENLVHFAAHKKHLGFYPGDLSLAPFKDMLANLKTTKGAIQFPYDKIDYDLIAYITKWRVATAKDRNKK